MVLLIWLKVPFLAQLVIADLHMVILYTSLEAAGPPAALGARLCSHAFCTTEVSRETWLKP
jgi:hypothetical protein